MHPSNIDDIELTFEVSKSDISIYVKFPHSLNIGPIELTLEVLKLDIYNEVKE